MRARLLMLLPALALTGLTSLCDGCGGGDSLPTGAWHPKTTGGSTGDPGTGSTSGGNGATASSSSGASSSGGGAESSSGGGGSGGESSSSSGASSSGASSSSGGGTGTGAQPPTNAAVTLAQSSLQVALMDSATVQVSIAPNGYTGTMALAATNLPTGATASFDNATVTLDGSTTATATLTLTTLDSTPPGEGSVSVTATADGMTKSASLDLTVQAEITLHIPAGVNNTGATVTNPNSTAFGPYPIKISAPANLSASNPITVNFYNDDTVSHEIHADNASQGFGHDPGPFPANSMDPYVREVNAGGTFDFYLHDQGAPITIGRLFVEVQEVDAGQ